MSAEEEVAAAAEHIIANAQAGEFISVLLTPAVASLRELVDGLVESTAKSLPIFRAIVGDEAGDLIALAQLVDTCRRTKIPARELGELASYAILQLAKAKLAASDG